ncbi:MAG: putative tricarboxylic transport rane protein [Clostridia bacterium]|jgi:putative tricarboxylic transport membrane protein|nr:putative tricarboxylic transport rane protein [Clostridia bacterium]
MDIFSPQVIASIVSLKGILLITGGVMLGLVFGAIPGLTATLGIALAIPITFILSPLEAMATLGGIFIGGISGGLVSATLINMPGTPSSICTTFDAAPLAQKGRASEALSIGVFSSFIGGIFSWIVLVTVSPQLAKIAIQFGPYEYFWLAVLGISVIIGLGGDAPSKAFVAAVIGLLISMIGVDPVDGLERFTFGLGPLRSGFSLIPTMVGLFVVSEVLLGIEDIKKKYVLADQKIKKLSIKSVLVNYKESIANWLRSSVIGTFLGILPGVGGAIANFICYDIAKKFSKNPQNFGKGEPQGIIASETGNNATTGGALVPMLTLGIPGDSVTAVMLGALLLHGVRPGPMLFQVNKSFVSGFFLAVLIANVIMLFLMFGGGIRFFIKALTIPRWFLFPLVLVMIVAGSWTLQYSTFDVWSALFLGFMGYFLRKLKYPMAPMVLGVILAPIMEENFRRAMVHSQGALMPFFTRPYSAIIVVAIFLSIFTSLWFAKKQFKTGTDELINENNSTTETI